VSDEIVIRELGTQGEYAACVALQRATWGQAFNEAVPPSIMLVTQKLGGVTAGAFDPDGTLLGFVFGITGVERGAIVHWSDMLAVRPEAQNAGIGRRLKEYQREAVARVGATLIYWTFDPLVARNAHLNFNVFGVRAVDYARDMYGEQTGNQLSRGIGTDRLIVAWPVADKELEARRQETAATRTTDAFLNARVIGDFEHRGAATRAVVGGESHLRIAVPSDIAALQSADPARAAGWRASTREAFEAAFASRFRVQGFVVDAGLDRGFYLLSGPHT
jgi:chorismate synthase